MTSTWPVWGAHGAGLVSTELTLERQTTEVWLELAAGIQLVGSPAAGLKERLESNGRIFKKYSAHEQQENHNYSWGRTVNGPQSSNRDVEII